MRIGLLLLLIICSSLSEAATSLSIEAHFSKWYMVTTDLKAPSTLQKNKVQEWGSYLVLVDSKSPRVFVAKGYSEKEVERLWNQKQLEVQLWNFLVPKAWADTDCGLQNKLNQASVEIQKITAESIIAACEWNPSELLKQIVQKVVDDAKGLLSLDILNRIGQAIETARNFIQEFKNKVLPGLSKLAEAAPELVNNWACTKIRNEIPVIALSVAIPGYGARKIPMVLAESLNDVRFLVSDQMVGLVKAIAKSGKLEMSALKVFSKLSPNQPEFFQDIKVHPHNLEIHATRHAKDFSSDADPTEYYRNLDEFIGKKDSSDVYFKSDAGPVTKFNPENGNALILSEEGRFISFYRLEGKTAEDRMLKFINKQAAYERRFQQEKTNRKSEEIK